MKLLDVNVWLAAAWARHVHHPIAKTWMDREDDDLLFCRVTELAFLRLVTKRTVTGDDALTRRQTARKGRLNFLYLTGVRRGG